MDVEVKAKGRRSKQHSITGDVVKATAFWLSVETGDVNACWPWTGYSEKGYGRFFWDGRMRFSHDLALMFFSGEKRQRSLDTRHLCGNSICCNPTHLRYGTRKENVQDSIQHGTFKYPPRKLSEADVVVIKRRLARGAGVIALAAEYGVSAGMISSIKNGTRWRSVSA